jgi:uncharacterized FlaG/YvyC family protein
MAENEQENGTGTGDTVVEEPGAEEPVVEEAAAGDEAKTTDKVSEAMEQASKSVSDAFKQVEKQVGSISKALGSALQERSNVVMVRVNDDSLHYLDMLIEADITKSRSESAAFLINEGIKANEGLFNKIREITDQIAALKSELREVVEVEDE